VPVPAQVGVEVGDHDDVTETGRDVLVAAGAEVALGGLVGLDAPHVDVAVDAALGGGGHRPGHPNSAHARSAAQTARAAITMT
jgi:hypothetical protein